MASLRGLRGVRAGGGQRPRGRLGEEESFIGASGTRRAGLVPRPVPLPPETCPSPVKTAVDRVLCTRCAPTGEKETVCSSYHLGH